MTQKRKLEPPFSKSKNRKKFLKKMRKAKELLNGGNSYQKLKEVMR